MPEIINLAVENGTERIEIEMPDDACVINIECRHDEGTYYTASADWLMSGGIDMWSPAYIGTSDTLLEAWQRIYAYMGV